MDKFRYKVALIVEVDAYSQTDAWEAVQDAFGLGDNMGVTVTDCEYRDFK